MSADAWDRVLRAWLDLCAAWRDAGGSDAGLARILVHVGDSVGRRGPAKRTASGPTGDAT